MCGRFHFGIVPKQISERVKALNLVFKTGEIFPTDQVLCVIPSGSKVDLAVMSWGIKAKSLLINAKIETIDERYTFSKIKDNRCAIICDGFYEWDKDKSKYLINFETKYMYLACIFNENNELVILTKDSNEEFKKIHDRIPVIMDKNEMLDYIHGINKTITDKKLKMTLLDKEISLFEVQ